MGRDMAITKIIVVVLTCVVSVVFFTLVRNEANLFQAPGFNQRLSVFLSSNTAVTSDNPDFEELRTPVFNISADALYKRVVLAGSKLGWQVAASDKENQDVHFIVLSRLFLFEDDVLVQVKFIDTDTSSLFVQSSSRKGLADLAANSGHIQALIAKINQL
jgi:uncharacterized protein (DUF1499 family)